MPDDAAPATFPSTRFPAEAEREARVFRAGHAPAPVYAALDLGTNNCRLLVAAPVPGAGPVAAAAASELSTASAASSGSAKASPRPAVCPKAPWTAPSAALAACAEKLARRPVRGFHAVATEACRRAANGPAFLARVEAETGLRPRVISAREEAELAMESLRAAAGSGRPPRPPVRHRRRQHGDRLDQGAAGAPSGRATRQGRS